MNELYNIYCDESCHLENDKQGIMVLGGVWCENSEKKNISDRIKDLKLKHNAKGELKWTKVSKSKINFYIELVDLFFEIENLNFRCFIVDDKSKLDHNYFNQGSHDTFYYKMYFLMLNSILSPDKKYNIYLDIKDTRSKLKIQKLRKVLNNNMYDFSGQTVEKLQHIRSHESQLIQLTDFLIGAVSYKNRNLDTNIAKETIVKAIENKIKHKLSHSTSKFERKFNIFIFSPTKVK